ncbi:aspartic peptidase [Tanacetum coccineum]
MMETILKAYGLWETLEATEKVDERKIHTTKAMILTTKALIPLFRTRQSAFVSAGRAGSHEFSGTVWEPSLESYPPLIAPITKRTDAYKDLYSVEIMTDVHSDFLIDTDARLAWHECIVQPLKSTDKCPINTLCNTYVPCSDVGCSDIRTFYSYESPSCIPVNNDTILPGEGCTCPVNVANPVTGECLSIFL